MLNQEEVQAQYDQTVEFIEDVIEELNATFKIQINKLEGYQINELGETGLVTTADGKFIFILPYEEGQDAMLMAVTDEELNA
jgi:hypothetical protein